MRSKKQESVKRMIQSYRDLQVYERSYRAALGMYQVARKMPKDELFGLSSQVKRAATSIPLNIAEGYGKRESGAEFKRFLLMAIGSCDEMKVLLDFMKDLGFIDRGVHSKYQQEYDEIGRMLMVLRNKWR